MAEFDLDLDVIKAKIVSLSKKPCLVNTTSSVLLRAQDVENYFRCFFIVYLFTIALKKAIFHIKNEGYPTRLQFHSLCH